MINKCNTYFPGKKEKEAKRLKAVYKNMHTSLCKLQIDNQTFFASAKSANDNFNLTLTMG